MKDLVDHIDHAVKIAGIDHVGISSDFDGGGVDGWDDASETPNVTIELVSAATRLRRSGALVRQHAAGLARCRGRRGRGQVRLGASPLVNLHGPRRRTIL